MENCIVAEEKVGGEAKGAAWGYINPACSSVSASAHSPSVCPSAASTVSLLSGRSVREWVVTTLVPALPTPSCLVLFPGSLLARWFAAILFFAGLKTQLISSTPLWTRDSCSVLCALLSYAFSLSLPTSHFAPESCWVTHSGLSLAVGAAPP